MCDYVQLITNENITKTTSSIYKLEIIFMLIQIIYLVFNEQS